MIFHRKTPNFRVQNTIENAPGKKHTHMLVRNCRKATRFGIQNPLQNDKKQRLDPRESCYMRPWHGKLPACLPEVPKWKRPACQMTVWRTKKPNYEEICIGKFRDSRRGASDPRWAQICWIDPKNILRWSEVISDDPRWSHARWSPRSQTIPDDSRWFQLVPRGAPMISGELTWL